MQNDYNSFVSLRKRLKIDRTNSKLNERDEGSEN